MYVLRNNPKIGILGGMGPRATVYFEEMLLDTFEASSDQDNPTIISLNRGEIPDRTAHLVGSGPSPIPMLRQSLQQLVHLDVDIICMPCNTAHAFYDELTDSLDGQVFLHMPRLVTDCLRDMPHVSSATLLSTRGTIAAHVYLSSPELTIDIPQEDTQILIDQVIYLIKSGDMRSAETLFREILQSIPREEGRCVLLGCTELSLFHDLCLDEGVFTLDAMQILCDAAVRSCERKNATA